MGDAVLLHSLLGNEAEAKEMLLICKSYKKEAKKDWGRQDLAAFDALKHCPFGHEGEAQVPDPKKWRPELYEALKLTTEHRAVNFMSDANLDNFLHLLRTKMRDYDDDP